MIAEIDVGNRDVYLFFAGLVALIVYGALKLRGRDVIIRGPSPEATWTPWEALALIVGALFLQMVASSLATGMGVKSVSRRILVSWSAPLAVCLYVCLNYFRNRELALNLAPFPLRVRARGFVSGVLFWLGSMPAVFAVFVIWIRAYEALGGEPREQAIIESLVSDPVTFFLTALIFAPLAEEVLFRGLLYPSLKRFGGTVPALLLSGAIFSVAHVSLTVGPPLFVLGVLLALSYELTGTLWTPIGFHAAFNLWTFLGKMA